MVILSLQPATFGAILCYFAGHPVCHFEQNQQPRVAMTNESWRFRDLGDVRTPNPVWFATENAKNSGAPFDPDMWLRLLITYCKRCRSNMQQGMQGMQGLQPMQQMGPGWGKGPMTPMAPGSQCLGGARLLDDMKIARSKSSTPEMAGLWG
jgi:hypothetical protein